MENNAGMKRIRADRMTCIFWSRLEIISPHPNPPLGKGRELFLPLAKGEARRG